MPVLIVLILFPLVEIVAFITVSGVIGFLNALLLVIMVAVFGVLLVKYQGINSIFSAQQAMLKGEMPSIDLFGNLCLVTAGILFILPGFISDILGFFLLLPFTRNFLRRKLEQSGRFTVTGFNAEFTEFHDAREYHRPNDPGIIEAEYETLERNKDEA